MNVTITKKEYDYLIMCKKYYESKKETKWDGIVMVGEFSDYKKYKKEHLDF
jgi:hypothetical protein